MKYRISIYHACYLPLSETFIYRQLQGLRESFDLRIFSRLIRDKDEFPEFDPVPMPRPFLLCRPLGIEARFIARQLRGSALVHANFGYDALDMEPHARRAGIPITAFFLGNDASARLRDPEYCRKLRRACFQEVFVNSQDMRKRLLPYLHPDTPCSVVYCGIPLERFPFRERRNVTDGATFLQVSRLDGKKGVDVTIKAFSRYRNECDPTARLLIAGDGPLRAELEQLAASLDLARNIGFIGSVGYRRYLELLQSADVFVHPSNVAENGDMEGIPTAICEAMACGLPVLSTRHSGIPEIIDDGENGLLVDERDAEGLYQKMLLLRSIEIANMSRNARVKIEARFDHRKTMPTLANHLLSVIERGAIER